MSTATPATPAVPASPSVKKKAKPSPAAKLLSLGADLVFALVAAAVVGVVLNYTAADIVNSPSFGPSLGMFLVAPAMIFVIWLAVHEKLIPRRLVRAGIIVVLVIIAAVLVANGVRQGFWQNPNLSALWCILTVAAVTGLFWFRRWLQRTLKL